MRSNLIQLHCLIILFIIYHPDDLHTCFVLDQHPEQNTEACVTAKMEIKFETELAPLKPTRDIHSLVREPHTCLVSFEACALIVNNSSEPISQSRCSKEMVRNIFQIFFKTCFQHLWLSCRPWMTACYYVLSPVSTHGSIFKVLSTGRHDC